MQAIVNIVFWEFLILYQTLFSRQVKRIVIICNKHGMQELIQELPNNSGSEKISKDHEDL